MNHWQIKTKKDIENKIIQSSLRIDSNSNEINEDINSGKENNDEKIVNVMKNLKFLNIIKSFFCCNDKKTNLYPNGVQIASSNIHFPKKII